MLVHAGVNVDGEGAPIETYSLNQLGIDKEEFANTVLHRFKREYDSVQKTLYKVIGVN
jgi:hypothetical protein